MNTNQKDHGVGSSGPETGRRGRKSLPRLRVLVKVVANPCRK